MNDEKFHRKMPGRAQRGWLGLTITGLGCVILFLCNYDDYHFPWLLAFARLSLIMGFVMFGVSLAPGKVGQALMAHKSTLTNLTLKSFFLCFLWVGIFFALGLACQYALPMLDENVFDPSAVTSGVVVAVDTTASKGGRIEWAVYEFPVEGKIQKGAVRNASLNLQQGEEVTVHYLPSWPRRSRIGRPFTVPSG